MQTSNLSRLVRAGLLTAVIDGLFSSVLVSVFYGSTVSALWRGVAVTALGPSVLDRGPAAVLVGLAIHVGVAFAWATVFLLLYTGIGAVRRFSDSPGGVYKVASLYGPSIWLVMSLVVIPTLTKRPPSITYRWWIQFFGHIPFVALPIVASIARGRRNASA